MIVKYLKLLISRKNKMKIYQEETHHQLKETTILIVSKLKELEYFIAMT